MYVATSTSTKPTDKANRRILAPAFLFVTLDGLHSMHCGFTTEFGFSFYSKGESTAFTISQPPSTVY